MKWSWIIAAVMLVIGVRNYLSEEVVESATTQTESALRAKVQPRIDNNVVKSKLHQVRTALHQYNIESGEVPTGFDEIIQYGLIRAEDVTDPWGQRFEFRSEKKETSSIAFAEEYEIFIYSAGPDGIKDNGDDIYI